MEGRSREPELGAGSTFLTLQGLAVGALEEGFVDHSWWSLLSAPTGMVPSTCSREASLVCDLFACFEGSACVRKRIRRNKFLCVVCSMTCAFW